MSWERLKAIGAENYRRVGRRAKLNGAIATKRMAWPQNVEVKNGVEWWSSLPIKTEEPKKTPTRSLSISFNFLWLIGFSLVAASDLTINKAKILSNLSFDIF